VEALGGNKARQFTKPQLACSTNNCLIFESEVVIPYQTDTGRRQVFGLTGIPISSPTGFLAAIASHSYQEQCLMMAFVPEYRYGLAPDSDRVPSCDAPEKGQTNDEAQYIVAWFLRQY
jgi:hypothetical protein